jgi:hypothetical protein
VFRLFSTIIKSKLIENDILNRDHYLNRLLKTYKIFCFFFLCGFFLLRLQQRGSLSKQKIKFARNIFNFEAWHKMQPMKQHFRNYLYIFDYFCIHFWGSLHVREIYLMRLKTCHATSLDDRMKFLSNF